MGQMRFKNMIKWFRQKLCSHQSTSSATERELAWYLPNYFINGQTTAEGTICNQCGKLIHYKIKPHTNSAILYSDPFTMLKDFYKEKKSFNCYYC